METLRKQALTTIELIEESAKMPDSVKWILIVTLRVWIDSTDESAESESAFKAALERINATLRDFV